MPFKESERTDENKLKPDLREDKEWIFLLLHERPIVLVLRAWLKVKKRVTLGKRYGFELTLPFAFAPASIPGALAYQSRISLAFLRHFLITKESLPLLFYRRNKQRKAKHELTSEFEPEAFLSFLLLAKKCAKQENISLIELLLTYLYDIVKLPLLLLLSKLLYLNPLSSGKPSLVLMTDLARAVGRELTMDVREIGSREVGIGEHSSWVPELCLSVFRLVYPYGISNELFQCLPDWLLLQDPSVKGLESMNLLECGIRTIRYQSKVVLGSMASSKVTDPRPFDDQPKKRSKLGERVALETGVVELKLDVADGEAILTQLLMAEPPLSSLPPFQSLQSSKLSDEYAYSNSGSVTIEGSPFHRLSRITIDAFQLFFRVSE
ncbi:hypothetical protein V6N11_030967 [Hibiscus sabdariffa]|uniref:Uncharacterized protein n=1 Tax=Hibiscus sabdariffa TaxID=183260 RepID=A0ABR2NRY1_9ROSI